MSVHKFALAIPVVALLFVGGIVALTAIPESDSADYSGLIIKADVGDYVNETFSFHTYAGIIQDTSIDFEKYGLDVSVSGNGIVGTHITISGFAKETVDSDFTIRLFNATSGWITVEGHLSLTDDSVEERYSMISAPYLNETGV